MFVCVHLLILLLTLTLVVQNGFAALHLVCQEGHLRVAECLIDAKADLNLLSEYKRYVVCVYVRVQLMLGHNSILIRHELVC